MGTVQNALKILQQNGYLVFTDDEENPARLMFCVSRDDLYSLRVEREDLDNILRTILRLYTGVFTGLRPVDVQEMAIYTGYTEERVMEPAQDVVAPACDTVRPQEPQPHGIPDRQSAPGCRRVHFAGELPGTQGDGRPAAGGRVRLCCRYGAVQERGLAGVFRTEGCPALRGVRHLSCA